MSVNFIPPLPSYGEVPRHTGQRGKATQAISENVMI